MKRREVYHGRGPAGSTADRWCWGACLAVWLLILLAAWLLGLDTASTTE